MVEVYGELLCGRRFCQSAGISLALLGQLVDVVGQRQRHHVGLEAVDHRARLLARAAVRLLDGHGVAGLGLPVLGERGVEVLVQLARRVVARR